MLERARLVHAFEIDRRWLPRLEELAAAEPRFVVHAGDALKADLGALEPPPTALVANLAYNIAIPLIMTTIAELPSVRRWAVMVQRELGERLFAVPSTKAYAAVSVLTQLACRLEKARPVPASAFRPRPRVESSFVTFVRREAAGDADPGAPDAVAAAPGPGRVRRGLAPRAAGVRPAPQDARQLARRRRPRARHAEPRRRARGAARAGPERGGASGGARAAAVADVRAHGRPGVTPPVTRVESGEDRV